MPLASEAARRLAEGWAANRIPPWSDGEVRATADLLVELSAAIDPHVVDAATLAPDMLETYLTERCRHHLEEWLTLAASRLRRATPPPTGRLRPGSASPALGLRSATFAEVEALPGVGPALAEDVRTFLGRQPQIASLAALQEIDGIGPDRLAQLRDTAWLERPVFTLTSASLRAFLRAPTVANALTLLERTDLSFQFGDENALARRVTEEDAAPHTRFNHFLAFVIDRARVSAPGAAGTLAPEVVRWVERHRKREALRAGAEATTGAVLVDAAYVAAAKSRIDAAQHHVALMLFIGTDAAGAGGAGPSPLLLVEALEAAAGRGVTVRVLLDQDDGGEPYGTAFINRPLVQRLGAAGVAVKVDDPLALLHSKVLVVDDLTAIVGSHNWTRSGFAHTHEVSVMVDAPATATFYRERFDALWDGALAPDDAPA